MRHMLLAATLPLLVVTAACSGGSSSPARTATPPAAPTGASASSAATTAAVSPSPVATSAGSNVTPVAPGDEVEVEGVVGTLTTDPKAIEITRLSGADVNRIEVQDSTDIRSAGGGRIDFSAIRTSDRIIADGRISDRGDALVATDITISAVVPGAQPGG